jgi:multidrug resistance efflux pump
MRMTPKQYRRYLLSGLTLVAVLGAGCNRGGLAQLNSGELVFSGTVETREIRVGSKVGGRVAAVLVEEGDEVKEGEALVRLEAGELEAQREQAQARIDQQQARLTKLLNGSRPEELAQARAAAESARANFEAVRNWPREEEIATARSAVAAADADVKSAEASFARTLRLRETGDISQQEFDVAKFRLENLKARKAGEQKRLDLLLNGSRKEDVKAAEERYRQAQENERLISAGPRKEEIADARAQLAEAKARLDQIQVQISEGEVKSPALSIVEVLSIRPGDLLVPNQTIARLLEKDQIFVRVYIPEPKLGLIKTGQEAKVKIDTYPDRIFSGIVEQINSQAEFTPRNVQSRDERSHQVFGVKVRIENKEGKIKPGMAAEVYLQ